MVEVEDGKSVWRGDFYNNYTKKKKKSDIIM